MNIGFDLDKVLIDYPPFLPSVLFDKFYKEKDNGVLLYRIPTYPEQLVRKTLHFSVLRAPMKKNLDFLRSIPKKDNKLYLISSRFGFLKNVTNKLVKKHQLDKVFDGLYFNFENQQPHEFKNEVLKKLHLDVYIDDDLSLIKYVARHNQHTKFFWLNHVTQQKPLAKNVFAIHKLEEIFSKINPKS